MRKFGLLGTSALRSAAVLGLFAAAAAPAYAQAPDPVDPGADPCEAPAELIDKTKCPDANETEQAEASTPGTDDSAAAGDSGEAITVVGSRIRRNQFNTAEPVTLITRDEATQAGFNSAADVLQSTAVTTGSAQINNAFGGFVTVGGPGANTLSLRGLGPSRTLVLLNGRRVAPAGSRGSVGSADLNVLPSAMIDRIEILKAGASSIYGSDAVAGVVNIVTRTNVNGFILEGQHNVTQDGGANSERYSAVFGYNSDRLHIAGSAEYYNRDALTLGQRDWTLCQTSMLRTAANRTPGSADFIDPRTGQSKCYPTGNTGESGVTVNTLGTSNTPGTAAPGNPVLATYNRFRPNPLITTGPMAGYEGVSGGSLNVRDTFDPRMYNQALISPVKIYTGYLQGAYETNFLGNAEFYAELLVNRRESSQLGFRQLSLDYIKGSPLIPANLQFSTILPLVGGQSGSISTPTQAIGVRGFIGWGNYNNHQEVDFKKLGGGFRGDFLLDGWRYDVYASKTWSDATYTTDIILTNRIAQSLDVVASGGGFVCRNPVGGCVAAPALTPAVIGGELPQAWRDFVNVDVTGTTDYRETMANVTFDGPLFTLPGGELQVAIGAEYRKARIDDTPSPESQAGNLYNFTSSAITRGSDSVWELFGEVEIPLIRDSFIHDFTINASARYTEYESYGGDTTYKIGALLSPFKWISFRGSYGTSYRAPALFEQFLGATSGFLAASGDPCNNYTAPGVDPIRAANCASENLPLQGTPPTFNATSGIRVLSGGGAATGLEAETSKNWSIGGVLQPNFGDQFGDFSLAVDYFDIKVENGVSRAGAGNILALCYDDPDFRAGGSFCRFVTRAPGSAALTVADSYVNLSEDNVEGIDFTLRYARDLGPGRIRIGAAVTKYFEQSNRLFSDDPLDDFNGSLNTPDLTGTFDAAYTVDKFNLRYGLEWINDMESYTLFGRNPDTTNVFHEVPDYFLHNASVQYRSDDFGITLGVRNLLNRDPPQISAVSYNRVGNAPLYSGYDYLGRTFFVNVTTAF
jgi:iron complex outermembrane receptor protein